MINAIAVWNTRYFEQAQAALARQGVPVPEHAWQHLSTLQCAGGRRPPAGDAGVSPDLFLSPMLAAA